MSLTTTRGAEGLNRVAFSMEDIDAMQRAGVLPYGERFEVIDGEIVPLAAQNMPHMLWKSRLTRWTFAHIRPPLDVFPEATLRLRDERPAWSFESDLLVIAPEPGMQAIRPAMVRLAVEIADTSADRDVSVKVPRYAQFGVTELWIIDVGAGVTHRCRAPGEAGYGEVVAIPFTDPIAPLFYESLTVRLAELG